MTAMTMTIEPVRAFNGLDVLVARDEGLFEREGLDLQIAALPPEDTLSTADGTLTHHSGRISVIAVASRLVRVTAAAATRIGQTGQPARTETTATPARSQETFAIRV